MMKRCGGGGLVLVLATNRRRRRRRWMRRCFGVGVGVESRERGARDGTSGSAKTLPQKARARFAPLRYYFVQMTFDLEARCTH